MSQFPWAPPPNTLFDLATGNPQSLNQCRRLKFLRQLSGGMYLFDFREEATVKWKLCVDDVCLALMIVRMEERLCDYDIARALLDQGTRFFTLLHSSHFKEEMPLPKGIPRLRLNNYNFTVADYESYCYERDNILGNHRVAREALKRGGILWRLAVENSTFQDVLAGPSTVATLQHCCTSLIIDSENAWIDDTLSIHEMEVISGVYHVYIGNVRDLE